MPEITMATAVKLASIVVHVTEHASSDGHPYDIDAARGLCRSPDVLEWLAGFDPVLLPVRRREAPEHTGDDDA